MYIKSYDNYYCEKQVDLASRSALNIGKSEILEYMYGQDFVNSLKE